MFRIIFLAMLVVPLIEANASAARLVVMAINSGRDLAAPYDFFPPTALSPPGAVGFLLGVQSDGPDDRVSSVQVEFEGPGLVHQQVSAPSDDQLIAYPRIMTRLETQLNPDGIDYRRDDTYLIESAPGGWFVSAESVEGGLESDRFFRFTTFVVPAFTDTTRPLAYVVTTSPLEISGEMFGRDLFGHQLVKGFGATGVLGLDGSLTLKTVVQPSLRPGEILLGDDSDRAVYRLDRQTQTLTLLSNEFTGTGPNFESVDDVVVTPDGKVYVLGGSATGAAIFQVEPTTGNRTLVSAPEVGAGPLPTQPRELAVSPTGELFVSDDQLDAVFAIDPATGDRRIVASSAVGNGPVLVDPNAIGFDADGNLVVANSGIGVSAILRVHAQSGDRELVSNTNQGFGPEFDLPRGLLADASGRLITAEASAPFASIFAIDPVSGDRQILSDEFLGAGIGFGSIDDIALDLDGGLLWSGGPAIGRVDPLTGDRSIVREWSFGSDSSLAVVPSTVPEPSSFILAVCGALLLAVVARVNYRAGATSKIVAQVCFAVLAGAIFMMPGAARAAPLSAGEVVVFDDERDAIFAIDPVTGARRIVSSSASFNPVGGGVPLFSANDIAIDIDGSVLVTNNGGGLVRVDPATGDRVLVSQLEDAESLTISPTGDIYVLGVIAPAPQREILRIDRTTGAPTVVSRPLLTPEFPRPPLPPEVGVGPTYGAFPISIRSLPTGEIVVLTDDDFHPLYSPEVYRRLTIVDPSTGNRTLLSGPEDGVGGGPNFVEPNSLAVSESGRIALAAFVLGESILEASIVEIDPATGDRTATYMSASAATRFPREIAFAADGSVLSFDRQALFSIDTGTDLLTVLSKGSIGTGPNIYDVTALAVVPPNIAVPEPSSFVLAAIATIGLGVCRFCRRQMKKPSRD